MFKKTAIFIVFVFLFVGQAIQVAAEGYGYGLEETARKASYGERVDIYGTTSTVLQVLLGAVGIIFLAIMFYAGLRWMTARGNEEHTARAKDAMFNAMMGLILVVIAYGLTVFIFGNLLK